MCCRCRSRGLRPPLPSSRVFTVTSAPLPVGPPAAGQGSVVGLPGCPGRPPFQGGGRGAGVQRSGAFGAAGAGCPLGGGAGVQGVEAGWGGATAACRFGPQLGGTSSGPVSARFVAQGVCWCCWGPLLGRVRQGMGSAYSRHSSQPPMQPPLPCRRWTFRSRCRGPRIASDCSALRRMCFAGVLAQRTARSLQRTAGPLCPSPCCPPFPPCSAA